MSEKYQVKTVSLKMNKAIQQYLLDMGYSWITSGSKIIDSGYDFVTVIPKDKMICADETYVTVVSFEELCEILIESEMEKKDEDNVYAEAGNIRKAASSCADADRILRMVFPDAFKNRDE